jgi:hypothetical protein
MQYVTFSALLYVGILFPQKFKLILIHENSKMFSQKEDPLTLPDLSRKLVTHLLEMSQRNPKLLT